MISRLRKLVFRIHHRSAALRIAESLPGQLTATVHGTPKDLEEHRDLIDLLRQKVGRIVFNGYPTGVRVSWGQHHGGPWPATNTLHTSVGVTAVRRFLRPLAWQDAPAAVLPEELREGADDIPRRIDGRMVLPAT